MSATWLIKFRQKYGLSQAQLGKLAGCSGGLIDLLENMNGGITHPNIASRLADVCGATVRQHDSIVHKKHRGKYAPKPGRRYTGKTKMPAARKRPETAQEKWQIIKINRNGEELARYPSANIAQRRNHIQSGAILKRCRHELDQRTDEFGDHDVSFRYAAEWDNLSTEERREAVRSPRMEFLQGMEETKQMQSYTWKGEKRTIVEWAEMVQMPVQTLRYRLRKGWDFERAIREPVQTRFKRKDRAEPLPCEEDTQ